MSNSLSLIAITAIQRMKKRGSFATSKAPAVPPKIEVLAPGTHFVAANRKEYDDLIALGAARPNEDDGADKPAKKEAAAPKTPAKKKAAAPKVPDPDPDEGDGGGDGGGDGEGVVTHDDDDDEGADPL